MTWLLQQLGLYESRSTTQHENNLLYIHKWTLQHLRIETEINDQKKLQTPTNSIVAR